MVRRTQEQLQGEFELGNTMVCEVQSYEGTLSSIYPNYKEYMVRIPTKLNCGYDENGKNYFPRISRSGYIMDLWELRYIKINNGLDKHGNPIREIYKDSRFPTNKNADMYYTNKFLCNKIFGPEWSMYSILYEGLNNELFSPTLGTSVYEGKKEEIKKLNDYGMDYDRKGLKALIPTWGDHHYFQPDIRTNFNYNYLKKYKNAKLIWFAFNSKTKDVKYNPFNNYYTGWNTGEPTPFNVRTFDPSIDLPHQQADIFSIYELYNFILSGGNHIWEKYYIGMVGLDPETGRTKPEFMVNGPHYALLHIILTYAVDPAIHLRFIKFLGKVLSSRYHRGTYYNRNCIQEEAEYNDPDHEAWIKWIVYHADHTNDEHILHTFCNYVPDYGVNDVIEFDEIDKSSKIAMYDADMPSDDTQPESEEENDPCPQYIATMYGFGNKKNKKE